MAPIWQVQDFGHLSCIPQPQREPEIRQGPFSALEPKVRSLQTRTMGTEGEVL